MRKLLINKVLRLFILALILGDLWSQDTVRLFLDADRVGDTINVRLSADDFKDVSEFSITYNFPDTELNFAYSRLNSNLNIQSEVTLNPYLSFSWINPFPVGLSLPNGTVLAEFKFFVEKRSPQSCFDFNVTGRPSAFFGILSTIIPVKGVGICKNFFGGLVEGYLRIDTNNDCITDNTEPPVGAALIQFLGNNGTYFAITNQDGYFHRYLPFSNYSISPVNQELIQACQSSVAIDLNSNISTTYTSVYKQKNSCPLMEVEFIAPLMDVCKSNFAGIHYSNRGTIPANDVYITLELDASLSIEQSSLPFSIIGANLYKIDLGTVNAQFSGQVDLRLKASCNSKLKGRTVQNIARIYPNEYCIKSPKYSGAELSIISSCTGNENVFEIRNTGSGDMKNEVVFNTVEDDIMPNFGGKLKLDKDASMIIRYPANGKTRIITIDTISNHPYQVRANAGIEACGTHPDGSVSLSFINNYSQGDESPFVSRYSTELKESNNSAIQISSIPEGVGTNHYINKSDRIRYSFVAKNITNNLVKRLVIRNRIPENLDIATLQLAKSVNNFSWSIQEDRILEIVFEGLNLLPSTEDELLSKIIFAYSIKPNIEVPFNTVIENSAEVILDSKVIYNSESTIHTVGYFIYTIISDKKDEHIRISAYPNPCEEKLYFDLGKKDDYTIQFFNHFGSKICEEETKESYFSSNALVNQNAGIYYYLIISKDQKISSGKVTKSTR